MSLLVVLWIFGGQEISPQDREFFEAKIRPVLAEACYSCHNSQTEKKGGLAVDDRKSIRAGGRSGPGIVPGKPDQGLLLSAIRHATKDLRMPKEGAKLEDAVVRDFEEWVRRGAPDPRDAPPSPEELAAATSWEETLKLRKKWWSFKPIRAAEPPGTGHVIDRFVVSRLRAAGLAPADPADRRTLIRRVTFALTGLPPLREEIRAFLEDKAPGAYERLVDRLLSSDAFGERWARHWMDWFRYVESLGSEGDPKLPHAYRYRDYLIRALNADVPYDQLVREHLAGDLLENPRLNKKLGINESAMGLAHLRMPFIGFFPTDALDEQVRFTENQIDVLSKAFLGLTVSCARCHDHKFDAISQADFTALYGILASSRPALVTIDLPERHRASRAELAELKSRIRSALADAWAAELPHMKVRLENVPAGILGKARSDATHPLHAWVRSREAKGRPVEAIWKELARQVEHSKAGIAPAWELGGRDYAAWYRHGVGLPERAASAGEFHLLTQGDRIVSNIYPSGAYTHLLSSRHNGMLTSPRFVAEKGEIWFRALGSGGARARFVVQNYPRGPGTVYPVTKLKGDELKWQRWTQKQVGYWEGDHLYIEFATGGDIPVEAGGEEGRSVFGVSEVLFVKPGQPGPKDEPAEFVLPLFVDPAAPRNADKVVDRYRSAIAAALEAWRKGTASDAQARFLGGLLRAGVLSNSLKELSAVAPLIIEYRKREGEVPVPIRSPGVVEGDSFDQPFYPRGDHRKPGDPVARRFLEALGGKAYRTRQSGRRELAEDVLSPRNPLASRVIVNRLWHHLFGTGIVATPDNFGRLGEKPTHPELLDYLSDRFVRDGWSLKKTIRLIVTSSTYRGSSRAPAEAAAKDPANRLLSHFPIRRLEAEAIRDAMLAVTGRLQRERYGPGVGGRSSRRSVYVQVIRNRLDPFLTTFDAPEPLSARGRRSVTNVPGQSLTMMNDPWVIGLAGDWSDRIRREPDLEGCLNLMYETALGRLPKEKEIARARRFLEGMNSADLAVKTELERIAGEIKTRRTALGRIVDPVKARLLEMKVKGGEAGPKGPEPLAAWDFSKGADDLKSGLKGSLRGTARLEGGALVLDGRRAYFESARLPWDLREKTLEAWVMLDDLDQRAGGVMTVQTPSGAVFDSIVFAEQKPGEWLAGSDFFRRTQPFGGPREGEAANRAVHLATTSTAEGRIAPYRDGGPYGRPYRVGELRRFERNETTVIFGCRHLPAGGNRLLAGRILKARLYGRALTPEEVAASAGTEFAYVSEDDLHAALSPAERTGKKRLERELKRLEARRVELAGGRERRPADLWRDLAQSIFNLKEFIYIR